MKKVLVLAVGLGLLFSARPGAAQTINLRVSVKFILNSNNSLPSNAGNFGASTFNLTTPLQVANNVDYANSLLARHWRGVRMDRPARLA